ncbi:MAG TPA: hypothetical protein VFX92_10925 [Candidatus Krumholzibacteria bacterium]|nr:hypothetical protein [Candidatus Krumholzibacteria bacterium]
MKTLHLVLCIAIAATFFACDRNVTYTEEVAGPVPCAQCHDDSNLITGKETQWAESLHGTGEAYLRGTSKDCAACHSGNGFAMAVAAGQAPNQVTQGDPNPTRQDCRACHNIHTTYTFEDFSLRTTKPVALYAIPGATFDGGEGNLCVNCHQPRRDAPVAVGGVVTGISEHWGPHHGPQSSMILGLAGAGATGTPHQHYGVENTCVQCHLGSGKDHHFEPNVATCKQQACHPAATNFDINGRQTEIEALTDQLGDELLTLGLINENSPDGHPTVTSAPEGQAYALWNWLYVAHEDKSVGVHNYPYAKALLEAGIAALAAPAAAGSK